MINILTNHIACSFDETSMKGYIVFLLSMWWKLSQEFLPGTVWDEVAAVAAAVTTLSYAEVEWLFRLR